jgi:hypothetical protein
MRGGRTVLVIAAAVTFGACASPAIEAAPDVPGAEPSEHLDIIDASTGEVFEAIGEPPAGAAVLSPADAYARSVGHVVDVPDDTTARLGIFTMNRGAGAAGGYAAEDELVYAFTNKQCAPGMGPSPAAGTVSGPVSPRCTQWTIVDAVTGSLVDITWSEQSALTSS